MSYPIFGKYEYSATHFQPISRKCKKVCSPSILNYICVNMMKVLVHNNASEKYLFPSVYEATISDSLTSQ